MTIPRRNWLRLALFVIVLGAMPLARANAAQITIKANANVVKALTFTSKQDLDLERSCPPRQAPRPFR